MTRVPVDNPETLRHILSEAHFLLLDFDGPICSIFAGFPAYAVADQLRHILTEGGHRNPPDAVTESKDPFDVLRWASTFGNREAYYVEAALRAHEVEAASTAMPTPGSHEFMRTWIASGRPLAIVSNNSAAAVRTYLEIHGLSDTVAHISARSSADVALLKPAPYLINQAVTTLKADPTKCVLIGDSTTDIEAAQVTQTPTIGYANRSTKVASLAPSKPDAIVTSMRKLI
jgi:HAD superfamily hydrolase (TIGR01509 family)